MGKGGSLKYPKNTDVIYTTVTIIIINPYEVGLEIIFEENVKANSDGLSNYTTLSCHS